MQDVSVNRPVASAQPIRKFPADSLPRSLRNDPGPFPFETFLPAKAPCRGKAGTVNICPAAVRLGHEDARLGDRLGTARDCYRADHPGARENSTGTLWKFPS